MPLLFGFPDVCLPTCTCVVLLFHLLNNTAAPAIPQSFFWKLDSNSKSELYLFLFANCFWSHHLSGYNFCAVNLLLSSFNYLRTWMRCWNLFTPSSLFHYLYTDTDYMLCVSFISNRLIILAQHTATKMFSSEDMIQGIIYLLHDRYISV